MDSPGSGLCSVELLLRTCVQTVVLVSCNKPVGGVLKLEWLTVGQATTRLFSQDPA